MMISDKMHLKQFLASTFCVSMRILPACEETFAHLFWDCTYTRDIMSNFITDYVPEFLMKSESEKKQFLLYAAHLSDTALPGIVILAKNLLLVTLWEQHTMKKTPHWPAFRIRLENNLVPVVIADDSQNSIPSDMDYEEEGMRLLDMPNDDSTPHLIAVAVPLPVPINNSTHNVTHNTAPEQHEGADTNNNGRSDKVHEATTAADTTTQHRYRYRYLGKCREQNTEDGA